MSSRQRGFAHTVVLQAHTSFPQNRVGVYRPFTPLEILLDARVGTRRWVTAWLFRRCLRRHVSVVSAIQQLTFVHSPCAASLTASAEKRPRSSCFPARCRTVDGVSDCFDMVWSMLGGSVGCDADPSVEGIALCCDQVSSVCFKIENFPELEAVPPARVDFAVPVDRALGFWDIWGDVDRSYRRKVMR